MPELVYTIGHSTHSMARFIELLQTHAITAVADVRSHPYSRFNPQYNRENLQAELKGANLAYVFLGRELGARPEDESCYVDGKVHYDRLARTARFREGLARVTQGMCSHRIALMCAEKDPLTCHRTILVCRHLAEQGIEARHILEDGRLESHAEAVARLLNELELPERDLFRSRDEIVADAYELRGREIAYSPQPTSQEAEEEAPR